jgi:hypothetical protein
MPELAPVTRAIWDMVRTFYGVLKKARFSGVLKRNLYLERLALVSGQVKSFDVSVYRQDAGDHWFAVDQAFV